MRDSKMFEVETDGRPLKSFINSFYQRCVRQDIIRMTRIISYNSINIKINESLFEYIDKFIPRRVVTLSRPAGSNVTKRVPSFETSTLASFRILHSLTTIFLSAKNIKYYININ